jgi:hypothetical protein
MALQASLLKKYLKMSSVGSETYTIGSGMLRIPKIKKKKIRSKRFSLVKVMTSRSFVQVWPKKTPLNLE